jgi:hypothetical protein
MMGWRAKGFCHGDGADDRRKGGKMGREYSQTRMGSLSPSLICAMVTGVGQVSANFAFASRSISTRGLDIMKV